MTTSSKNILAHIPYWSVCALILLVPIFFLTWTSDIFDFNKQFLVYFLVLIGVLAFTVRAALEKKIELVRTPLDIPLFILLLVSLVSSLVSLDRYVSFWGELSNITYGFVPLLFYVLFYFLTVNTLQDKKRVRTAILLFSISIFVATVYFLYRYSLRFFNVPLATNFPFWNPLSNQNSTFGLFASIGLIFALGNMMIKKEKNIYYWLWIPLLVTTFMIHLFVGFRGVWLGLALALFLLLVFAISRLDEMKVGWVSVAFALMVVAILFAFLGTPRFLAANLPAEISLAQGASWGIARDTLVGNFKHFLFGSGPGTFVYAFASERNEDFNNTIAWNVRFLHPFSAFLELLTTTGVLGTIAFVIVVLVAVSSAFMSWFKAPFVRAKKSLAETVKELLPRDGISNLYFVQFVGLLLLLVSLFLTAFGTVHWWLFYFLLALLFSIAYEMSGVQLQKVSLKTSPQYSLVSSFVTILVFIGVIVVGIYFSLFYAAEVYAKKGVTLGNLEAAGSDFSRAVNFNGGRYQYHLRLAENYIARASEELGKNSPNTNVISQYVAEAVNEARVATTISSRNVAAWEFLANMYGNARALTGEAIRFQIEALVKAVELEPTNPVLQMNLGNAKLAAGNVTEARDHYKESVRLKQNFVSGYVSLSLLDEREGNLAQAIEYMATAASLNPSDPTALFNLGRLYYNRSHGDDLSRAEQLFMLATQVNPNYADALWSLGLVNERRGNLPEALRYYRRVQTLDPQNADVRAKVQSLLAPAEEKKK